MNENLQKVHIEKKIIFQQQLSNTSEMYKQLTELNNEILPHHQETEGFEITNDDLESEIVTMEEIIEEEVIGSPQSISFDLNLSIRKEPIDMSIVWAHVEEVIEKVIQEVSANVTDDEVDLYRERIKLQAKRSRVKHDPMSVPFHYAGQTFNIQSQKLILNALHFLKTHRKDDIPLSVKTPQEKAAKLLNISSSVIGKVRKNWKKGKLEQAGTRRRMAKRILDRVSPQDEEVILGIIRDLDDNGVTPTIPLILAAARVQVKFVGSRTSFRRILNRMGFRYGKLDKTVVMIDPKGGTIPNVGVNTGKVTPISANQGMEMELDFSDQATVVMMRDEVEEIGAATPITSVGMGAAMGGLVPPPPGNQLTPTPRLPRANKTAAGMKQFLEDVEETRRMRKEAAPRTSSAPHPLRTQAATSNPRAAAPTPRGAAPTPRGAALTPRVASSTSRAATFTPRAAVAAPRATVRPPYRIPRNQPPQAATAQGLAMPFVMVRSAQDLLDVMRPIAAPAATRARAPAGARPPAKKRRIAPGKRRCFICKDKGHEAKNCLVQRPPRQN